MSARRRKHHPAKGGARILTLGAWAKLSIGGNPGHMSIEPASATDPDLPALVLLAFTVANEETRPLHRAADHSLDGAYNARQFE